MDAMGLAGDESEQGVAVHIDKSLAPGLDLWLIKSGSEAPLPTPLSFNIFYFQLKHLCV
jgi:hypothetical protein